MPLTVLTRLSSKPFPVFARIPITRSRYGCAISVRNVVAIQPDVVQEVQAIFLQRLMIHQVYIPTFPLTLMVLTITQQVISCTPASGSRKVLHSEQDRHKTTLR